MTQQYPKPPPPPARKPVSAPPPTNAGPGSTIVSVDQFVVTTGTQYGAERVVIYGPGGVGKSTLASLIPGRTLFLDIERSTRKLGVQRIDTIRRFDELRAVLQSPILENYDSIVIDSATKVEELAAAWVVDNVPHEKGGRVSSIEGYGWGKGWGHIYDAFLLFVSDLDRAVEKGKNVVLICHDCISDVPNPIGEDFIRYEPRLQTGKSGKHSIRSRIVEWADHVLFVGYDVVAKDGKGKGGGTRTIWTQERPDHIAKSRTVTQAVPFESEVDGTIWNLIFAKEESS